MCGGVVVECACLRAENLVREDLGRHTTRVAPFGLENLAVEAEEHERGAGGYLALCGEL